MLIYWGCSVLIRKCHDFPNCFLLSSEIFFWCISILTKKPFFLHKKVNFVKQCLRIILKLVLLIFFFLQILYCRLLCLYKENWFKYRFCRLRSVDISDLSIFFFLNNKIYIYIIKAVLWWARKTEERD